MSIHSVLDHLHLRFSFSVFLAFVGWIMLSGSVGCVVFCVWPSGAGVPVEDQQLSVALLMELAVQRGSLTAILAAVRLLLTVSSDVVDVDRDNRLSTVLMHAPLVPVLCRFQALAARSSEASDFNEVICYRLYKFSVVTTTPLCDFMEKVCRWWIWI